MKIRDVELTLLDIPATAVRSLLVCLESDQGLCGWGEAPLHWRVNELAPRRTALLSLLHGRSVFDIEEMLALTALRQNPALACALETACWDLIGKALGRPLCDIWGGAFRRHVPLAMRLPPGNAAAVGQAAAELVEHGFPEQIVESSGCAKEDALLVTSVLETVNVDVSFDARRKVSPPLLKNSGNLRWLVDVAAEEAAEDGQKLSSKCALRRGIASPGDVMAAIRAQSAKLIIIDAFRVGGLASARRCAHVAEAGGLAVALAAEKCTGIAVAAMLQTVASTTAFSSANPCDYYPQHEDVLAEPFHFADGALAVPQLPGLGIEVDRARLEKLQVVH